MIIDILVHTLLGLIAAATGYGVRSTCSHRGWLPHPKAHVALTVALVAIESSIAVQVVG